MKQTAQTPPRTKPFPPTPRAARPAALLAAFGAALALSCSLALDFDPEGKPCGGPEHECLEGYHCDAENKCVLGEGEPQPQADAGTDGGV